MVIGSGLGEFNAHLTVIKILIFKHKKKRHKAAFSNK
jgi:hypothetical protein